MGLDDIVKSKVANGCLHRSEFVDGLAPLPKGWLISKGAMINQDIHGSGVAPSILSRWLIFF